jgi:hypothetical protein
MKQKQPRNPMDVHVDRRLRTRRMMLGVGRDPTNRISASQLQHLSHLLKVAVPFFFEDAPMPETNERLGQHTAPLDEITGFMATQDGLDLARAFMRIRNIQLRRRIANLVNEIEASKS